MAGIAALLDFSSLFGGGSGSSDSPAAARLSTQTKKPPDEVALNSARRMERAEEQKAHAAAEEAARLQREHRKGDDVRQKLVDTDARGREELEAKLRDAEARRDSIQADDAARLAREREHAEEVRQRIVESSEVTAAKTRDGGLLKQAQADERRIEKQAEEAARLQQAAKEREAAKERKATGAHERTFGLARLHDDAKLELMRVIKEGDPRAVEELLGDPECDVNFQNQHGDGALLLAAWYGHTAIAARLLQAQASLDLVNCDGNCALNCAARHLARTCPRPAAGGGGAAAAVSTPLVPRTQAFRGNDQIAAMLVRPPPPRPSPPAGRSCGLLASSWRLSAPPGLRRCARGAASTCPTR